ncbi:MAG: ABC transporter substrate-binding protein [Nitriliruptoraceae bacterium]
MRHSTSKNRRFRASRLLAAGLGLALVLAACGTDDDAPAEDGAAAPEAPEAPEAPAEEPEEVRDTVTLTSQNDPGEWDITASSAADKDRWILMNVIEPLMIFNDAAEPTPGLAESWEVSDDGTEFVFHIREATFHNGEPVTMDDVMYSLNLNFESPRPTTAAAYEVVESIEQVGDRSVQFTLSRPSQTLFLDLGGAGGAIIPEDAHAGLAQNPIGTGPFRFGEYVPDSQLILDRNDDYWGDAPAMREVTVRFVPEPTAALNAMLAGEVDGFPNFAEELFSRIAEDNLEDQFKLVSTEVRGRIINLRVNGHSGPLADQRLRAAMMYSFDREEIVSVHGADFAYRPSCTYGTGTVPYFEDESPESCVYPSPDLDRAAELLEEAGYDGEPVEFSYIADWLEAEVISAQLEAAGFNIERNPMERARFLDEVSNVFPMPTDFYLIAGRAQMETYARPGLEDPAQAHFFDEEFNELMAQAEATTDLDEWIEIMRRGERIFQEQATVPMIASQLIMALVDPELEGWGDDESFTYFARQSFKLNVLSWS